MQFMQIAVERRDGCMLWARLGPWITTTIMKDGRGPSVANFVSVHHSLRACAAGASE